MKTVFPYRYIPELLTFACGCFVGLYIKPPLTRRGETYKLTTGSRNLKAQHKVLC